MTLSRKNIVGWRMLFAVSWMIRLPFVVAWYTVLVLGCVGCFLLELILLTFIAISVPGYLRELRQ